MTGMDFYREKMKLSIRQHLSQWGKDYEKQLRSRFVAATDEQFNAAISELETEGFLHRRTTPRGTPMLELTRG